MHHIHNIEVITTHMLPTKLSKFGEKTKIWAEQYFHFCDEMPISLKSSITMMAGSEQTLSKLVAASQEHFLITFTFNSD